MAKSKVVYQTTPSVQLAVPPALTGYVLVKVYEDVTGFALAQPIQAQDLKPRLSNAQSRAANKLKRLADSDSWHDRYGRPGVKTGIMYYDHGTKQVTPLYLNRVANYVSSAPADAGDAPLARIHWFIYRLDERGMHFERVAAQYP